MAHGLYGGSVGFRVALIAIGDELLSGAVTDANCAFLSRELTGLGGAVRRMSMVGDDTADIVAEVRRAVEEADLVMATGGLGPTSDDITRDALAQAAGVALVEDAAALQRMEDRYRVRNLPMNAVSSRQAQFPAGSRIIENPIGTADCFLVEIPNSSGRKVPLVSLPGVVKEVQETYRVQLVPLFGTLFPELRPRAVRVLKFFGLSESHIGSVIEAAKIAPEVRIGYRPVTPETWLKLSIGSNVPLGVLDAAEEQIVCAVGSDFLFTRHPDDNLADTLGALLEERGLTLAAAESCTGGMIAEMLVSRPNSSRYFLASVVSYVNHAKSAYLDVTPALLNRTGAVSREVAMQMAYSVKHKVGSDIGVSVTGVAGPGGGSEEKPVGTVWIGLAAAGREEAFRYQLRFDRNRNRRYAAVLALDLVRRSILGLPLTFERK